MPRLTQDTIEKLRAINKHPQWEKNRQGDSSSLSSCLSAKQSLSQAVRLSVCRSVSVATKADTDTDTHSKRTGQKSTNHNNHNHELKPISAFGNGRDGNKVTVLQKQQLESELTKA